MADWKTADYLLSETDMNNNAQIVYDYLHSKGCSDNAIFGILGNMWRESTVNPTCWQSGKVNNMSMGYGLCQWTPATKILDWLSENGYTSDSGEGQLESILSVSSQWGSSGNPYAPSTKPPCTWDEYLHSNLDIATLTSYFMYYWEKPSYNPSDNVLDLRIEHALEFAEIITSGGSIKPTPNDNIFTIICKTTYNTNTLTQEEKTLLQSLVLFDNIIIKQCYTKNKRTYGTNKYNKCLTILDNRYTIESVRNNGFLILSPTKAKQGNRIYLNPKQILKKVGD